MYQPLLKAVVVLSSFVRVLGFAVLRLRCISASLSAPLVWFRHWYAGSSVLSDLLPNCSVFLDIILFMSAQDPRPNATRDSGFKELEIQVLNNTIFTKIKKKDSQFRITCTVCADYVLQRFPAEKHFLAIFSQ